jgi:Ca2+-binding EF-hand superfamily protein
MRLAGANPTEADGENYRRELRDAGVTGLTVDVLRQVLESHAAAHPALQERTELEEAWRVVDSNGDGVVSGAERVELVRMLTTMGEPLTDDEMNGFLVEVDADADGISARATYWPVLAAWCSGASTAASGWSPIR